MLLLYSDMGLSMFSQLVSLLCMINLFTFYIQLLAKSNSERRFSLLHQENIEFQSFGLRNNVAQLCVLKVSGAVFSAI